MKPLLATARFQFHRDFPLDAAVDVVPYLERLGITHLYASPLATARAGSTHGYDVVDPTRINPELGGEAALNRLVNALRARGMGLVLDIVPNHMGVGGTENAWWLDVLEWGRASPYASFFDIDWDPPDASLRGRLLAPFLGRNYGEALEAGELQLRHDAEDGRFFVAYYDDRFPIDPRDYPQILLADQGPLEPVARALADLPSEGEAMRRAAEAARAELRRPENAQAIAEAVRKFDARSPEGRAALHALLERQHFRLAWWRAASDEINWRRFFDVNQLAGLRAELPEVFEATHALPLRLYREGFIDGLRIDHVDGLADPRGYCRKLRRRLRAEAAGRPNGLSRDPVLWVEKILATHERMPADWGTDGTTGYDFMNDAAALLHDPDGEAPLTALWTALTGRPAGFEEETVPARRQILRDSLSSELFATSVLLHRISKRDLATRDQTLTAIRLTLTELLAHFHVYRIYAGRAGITEADRRALDWALAGARRTVRVIDRGLLDQLAERLACADLRAMPPGTRRAERVRAAVRFEQLSAPTAAKSVEDTAFYRYGRLLSRNEVGSEPSQFALSVAGWHAASRERAKNFPRALLATATHDHKRGEDTRARLAVLSEIPGEWEAAVARWTRLNAPLKRDLNGPAPDAADELMLYQTLVGAWPLDLAADDASGLDAFRARISAWQQKALREAKRFSSWAAPNEAYEAACVQFLASVLDTARPARVAQDIAGFANRIAAPGALNALSQLVLRLTAPGVPDLYQGTDFWDFSLVDPDNRRPVDWAARAAALDTEADATLLRDNWRDGRIKQYVLHAALRLRSSMPRLWQCGQYVPVEVEGASAQHAVAFARVFEGDCAITIMSRLPARAGVTDKPHIALQTWGDTTLNLPPELAGRRWQSGIGPAEAFDGTKPLELARCLSVLPVNVLVGS